MNNNINNNNTNNEIMIQNIITKEKDRKKYTSYTMIYNVIKQITTIRVYKNKYNNLKKHKIITDSRFEQKD